MIRITNKIHAVTLTNFEVTVTIFWTTNAKKIYLRQSVRGGSIFKFNSINWSMYYSMLRSIEINSYFNCKLCINVGQMMNWTIIVYLFLLLETDKQAFLVVYVVSSAQHWIILIYLAFEIDINLSGFRTPKKHLFKSIINQLISTIDLLINLELENLATSAINDFRNRKIRLQKWGLILPSPFWANLLVCVSKPYSTTRILGTIEGF